MRKSEKRAVKNGIEYPGLHSSIIYTGKSLKSNKTLLVMTEDHGFDVNIHHGPYIIIEEHSY